jgi:hypothetical protein
VRGPLKTPSASPRDHHPTAPVRERLEGDILTYSGENLPKDFDAESWRLFIA